MLNKELEKIRDDLMDTHADECRLYQAFSHRTTYKKGFNECHRIMEAKNKKLVSPLEELILDYGRIVYKLCELRIEHRGPASTGLAARIDFEESQERHKRATEALKEYEANNDNN